MFPSDRALNAGRHNALLQSTHQHAQAPERPRFVAALVAMILLAAVSGVANAGQFEIVRQPGDMPCDEYVQALNNASLSPLFSGERPIPADNPRFSKPTWTSLDLEAHSQVLKSIFVREVAAGSHRTWEEFLELLTTAKQTGNVRLETTSVDFDNDGDVDRAYRFGLRVLCSSAGCELTERSRSPFFWTYHVLREDDAALSVGSAPYAAQHYDSFLYNDRFYLNWTGIWFPEDAKNNNHSLVVVQPKLVGPKNDFGLIPVCELRYSVR